MHVFTMLFAVFFLSDQALAEQASLCGKNSFDYVSKHKQELTGKWLLKWTKGLMTVSGQTQTMETLPPEMLMSLSFEGDRLQLRGETVKRNFDVYWSEEAIANANLPSQTKALVGALGKGETEALFGCDSQNVPYLAGTMLSKRKGPQTSLHLWMLSSTQIFGISYSDSARAVVRMTFLLNFTE